MKTTKSQILYESFKLFLSKGYKDVTMNDLVKASSLSKGAFYHYFVSKEDLFKQSITAFFFTGLTERKFVPSFMVSVNENLNNLIDFKANAYKQLLNATQLKNLDTGYFSLIFQAIKMFPEFRETLKAGVGMEEKTVATIFEIGIENGEVNWKLSPKDLSSMFTAMLDGVELHTVIYGEIDSLHSEEKRLAVEFCKMIKSAS